MRHTPFWVAAGVALLVSALTASLDVWLASGVDIEGAFTALRYMAAAGLLQATVTVPLLLASSLLFRGLPVPPAGS